MNELPRRDFLRRTASGLAAVALVPDSAALFPTLPDDAKLRLAVVGCGKWGRTILDELATIDAASVVAVCDLDEKRRRGGAKRAPGAADYARHRHLLEKTPDVEAVIVATPTHAHRAVVEDALAAGKHVYCEAPLAHTADDARAIVAAAADAEAAGRVVQAGYLARSNPVYQLARSFYRSGAIRSLVSARGQYHKKTSWRSHASEPERYRAFNWRLYRETSLGLPGELGSHALDTVHWFTKKPPRSVAGSGALLFHQDDDREVEDHVVLDYDLAGSTGYRWEASLANSFEGSYDVLYGTHGTIKLAGTHAWLFKEADAPTLGFEVYAHTERFHKDEGIVLIADATQLASQGKLEEGIGLPHAPVHYGLTDFLTSCLKGEEARCTAADALVPTLAGIAADEAVRNSARVPLSWE